MMPLPRTRRLRSIVCGVDLSRPSAKALRYAAALAGSCGGSVTAVFAIDPLLTAATVTAYDERVLERAAGAELARFVRATLGPRQAARIACVVAMGTAGHVITDQARRLRADVVVLATNARRGFSKLFFGSTSEAVLRRFGGAVLVIPAGCRQPTRAWPGSSIVAAIGTDSFRRAQIAAAARVAELFGAWLSIVSVAPAAAGEAAAQAGLIIYALPPATRLRRFRQGHAAYSFVCGARAPVLVVRAGRRGVVRVPPARRAA